MGHLTVHDITGRKIRTLVSTRHESGPHQGRWDGLDEHGKQVASGVFLARLQMETESHTLKLTFLR